MDFVAVWKIAKKKCHRYKKIPGQICIYFYCGLTMSKEHRIPYTNIYFIIFGQDFEIIFENVLINAYHTKLKFIKKNK